MTVLSLILRLIQSLLNNMFRLYDTILWTLFWPVSSPEIGLHLFLLKRPVHRIGRFVFQGKMWSPCVIGLHGLIDHLLGFRKVFGARQQ